MADFLDQTKREIGERLTELKPFVDEYQRLKAAASALDISGADGAAPAPRAPSARRRQSTAADTGRRGRPKGSGKRSKQALELVTAKPGITIVELADAMKIKQNYLYRVLPALASDGLVVKKGRGWHPKQTVKAEESKPVTRTSVARKPVARKPARKSARKVASKPSRKPAARKKTAA